MKNGKSEQKKVFPSKEEDNSNRNKGKIIPKEVGTYNGFLIYDNNDKIKGNELNNKKNEFSEPPFKDWLIIHHNPKKNKSRFTNLFQEILENDKKLKEETKKKDKQSYEKSLLPNNLINDIEDDEIKISENKNNIINDENEIYNINSQIEDINLNNKIINEEFIINNNINTNTDIINNNNDINNSYFNPINNDISINKNNQNPNIINNNINNINNPEKINLNNIQNNNIINNNILLNYNQNLNNDNSNFQNVNTFLYSDNKYQKFLNSNSINSNSNSGFPSAAPTAPSSMDRKSSIYSFLSNSSGVFPDQNKIPNNNNNINDYIYFSNKSSFYDPNPKPNPGPPEKKEKKFDIKIDIKRIIYLEDRRTTLMIKNIPNKFNRDLLLSIIDQNFKSAYDLFILPTDANRYKNFGYSFINFTCSYYIPYFYFLFHRKKWSSTNSKKVCEITYSKIQGRNNLLSHYASKMIFKNEEAKKHDISEQKYIIPNEYLNIFNSAFPNYHIEKFETYFMAKMPFRY